MNLWAKRIGQLAVLAVALFFFSCDDETSTLGFQNPNKKFEIKFMDIGVSSSTLLLDSVGSSNFYATNDLNRLLVGQYVDDVFGTITATAFTQFVPTNYPSTIKKHLDSVYYVYDSVTLEMDFDHYAYGFDDGVETNKGMVQQINIHELTQGLNGTYDKIVNGSVGGQQTPVPTTYTYPRQYFTHSDAGAITGSIVEKGNQYQANLKNFDFQFNASSKEDNFVFMKLSQEFGQRLFDLSLNDTVSFRTQSGFIEKFPGLAITPEINDKIVGISTFYDSTVLRVHYRSFRKKNNTVKDTLTINFSFNNVVSYSKIDADRSASDLSFLTNKYEASSAGELRYIQAGTGVAVKLDFSAFYDSLDKYERLAINSAELKINGINIASEYHNLPPKSLLVKVIKPNNRFRKLTYSGMGSQYQKDVELINDYRGFINLDNRARTLRLSSVADSTLNILNDGGSFFTLNYSNENNWYRGSANLFFQQLYNNRDNEDKDILPVTSVLLIPYEPLPSSSSYGRNINGKTVDRIIFDKDDIVLRIYYTVPLVD